MHATPFFFVSLVAGGTILKTLLRMPYFSIRDTAVYRIVFVFVCPQYFIDFTHCLGQNAKYLELRSVPFVPSPLVLPTYKSFPSATLPRQLSPCITSARPSSGERLISRQGGVLAQDPTPNLTPGDRDHTTKVQVQSTLFERVRGGRDDMNAKRDARMIEVQPPEDVRSGCVMPLHLVVQRVDAAGAS